MVLQFWCPKTAPNQLRRPFFGVSFTCQAAMCKTDDWTILDRGPAWLTGSSTSLGAKATLKGLDADAGDGPWWPLWVQQIQWIHGWGHRTWSSSSTCIPTQPCNQQAAQDITHVDFFDHIIIYYHIISEIFRVFHDSTGSSSIAMCFMCFRFPDIWHCSHAPQGHFAAAQLNDCSWPSVVDRLTFRSLFQHQGNWEESSPTSMEISSNSASSCSSDMFVAQWI